MVEEGGGDRGHPTPRRSGSRHDGRPGGALPETVGFDHDALRGAGFEGKVGQTLTLPRPPVSLMVMEPGAYEFGDYWKLGPPMLLLSMVAAVFLVPVFWPF